jgi:hypothetical protein
MASILTVKPVGRIMMSRFKKKARDLLILESFAAFFVASKSNFIKGGD